MDSDEPHACAEVSIGSDFLFQSLVLILDDPSKVSTKGLVCVYGADAECLDRQGARCKPLTAPGIILKGLPACIRSNRRVFSLCASFHPSLTLTRCWKGCLGRSWVEFDACVYWFRP